MVFVKTEKEPLLYFALLFLFSFFCSADKLHHFNVRIKQTKSTRIPMILNIIDTPILPFLINNVEIILNNISEISNISIIRTKNNIM